MILRKATIEDAVILFKWSNDNLTRVNSYNKSSIGLDEHIKWFKSKLNSENCFFYMFADQLNTLIGTVRIEKTDKKKSIISITIAPEERGKGYSSQMIKDASQDFKIKNNNVKITAFVFTSNVSSFKAFTKAGFKISKIEKIKGIESYILEN